MKILKPGIIPGDRKYAGACGRCGAEVEFQESEGTHGPQRDPGIYVSCPTRGCGGMIWGNARKAIPQTTVPDYYPVY